MSNIFNKLDNYFNKIITVQQFIGNIFLILIMLIVTFDVLGRNLFNTPIKGSYEMVELGAALMIFFAFALTHREGEHISINFVVEKFPIKVQHILNGIVEIGISVMLLFMARHVFANGIRMMERYRTTTDLSIPIYLFLFIITVTIIIFALTAIFKAINQFRLEMSKE